MRVEDRAGVSGSAFREWQPSTSGLTERPFHDELEASLRSRIWLSQIYALARYFYSTSSGRKCDQNVSIDPRTIA